MRLYPPEDERDAPVVICSELPNNEGSSVTSSANQVAAEVIRYHKLTLPPVWIEHYPKEATDGRSETFELMVFSSYEVKERAPYLGETRLTIGEPTCKSLDRESVEALVGDEVLTYFLTTGAGPTGERKCKPCQTMESPPRQATLTHADESAMNPTGAPVLCRDT
jgi:hypothetical protein